MIDAKIVVDSSANMAAEVSFVSSVPLKIITDHKEYVDNAVANSGGGGSSESGESASPYAAKVFIVPDGVMTATEAAPYVFTPVETEEFLAQGDFKRTIVKYPEQILGIGALVVANTEFYVDVDSTNKVLVCSGTEFSFLATEVDGAAQTISVDYVNTSIQCLNNQGTIMGFCTKKIYTIKNN